MTKRLFLSFIFFYLSEIAISQNANYASPSSLYKFYSVNLSSNLSNPLKTGIKVAKDDYVYFEASNNEISLGSILGNNHADGGHNIASGLIYKKYDAFDLGSVVCLINGTPKFQARQMFNNIFNGFDEKVTYRLIADPVKMVKPLGIGNDYVPGNFFISEENGELSFVINDNQSENNKGAFSLSIYVISRAAHMSRNLFLKCPKFEPENNAFSSVYLDCKNRPWEKEGLNSIYYHGVENNAYRGGANYPGCQCIYKAGNLLQWNKYEGSFDIGFWKFAGVEHNASRHLHLILDVIPHDLFFNKYGSLYKFFDNSFSCGCSSQCANPNFGWVSDNKLNACVFKHPNLLPSQILKFEYGNCVNSKAKNHHCYYTETKICDTTDCSDCNEKKIFELMLSSKRFIAPPPVEDIPVTNCGVTTLVPESPILTTVHPSSFSIINYTIKIFLHNQTTISHIFHPGKIQRTVFQKRGSIYIGTTGEGNGDWKSTNVFVGTNGLWQVVDDQLKKKLKCKDIDNATLFLFDVSGSMADNNKWHSAKQSALATLNSLNMQAQSGDFKPSVSVLSFEGECNPNPTAQVVNFTDNLQTVNNAIENNLPPPGGGTPLPQAIEVAKDKLSGYLTQHNLKRGRMIILTDGESTCGTIRPANIYGYGPYEPQPGFQQSKAAAGRIKYYTVGFDIAPGSNAEKDLQYLAQSTGGKYLNAQNEAELTKAFQKFSKVYIPKLQPSLDSVSNSQQSLFNEGLAAIKEEDYEAALESFKEYVKKNAKDYNGVYNLALMYEANERFKTAVKFFDSYLQMNTKAEDGEAVKSMITSLQADAQQYYEYSKKVALSDLQYLDLHFKKIQNGESVVLAQEFEGFLKEKFGYYFELPEILGVDDRLFKTNANEVFKGLKNCVETIRRNPQTWDRDATPVLSRTFLNMERLLKSF